MCIFLPFFWLQQLGQSAQTIKRSKVRYDHSMNSFFCFVFWIRWLCFVCLHSVCLVRKRERKRVRQCIVEIKALLESVKNNKCASGGMLHLALLQHVPRCGGVCKTRVPPPEIFPPTVVNSALLLMLFHHCILNSRTVFLRLCWVRALIRCCFFFVVLTLPARNHLLCLLSFLKIIIYIWKTVKLLVCCLFCVVRTLRFSDFQGCQIFT